MTSGPETRSFRVGPRPATSPGLGPSPRLSVLRATAADIHTPVPAFAHLKRHDLGKLRNSGVGLMPGGRARYGPIEQSGPKSESGGQILRLSQNRLPPLHARVLSARRSAVPLVRGRIESAGKTRSVSNQG